MGGLNDDVEEGLPALEEDVVDVNAQIDNVDIPNNNPDQPDPDPIVLKVNEFADEADSKEPSVIDLFGFGVVPGEVPNFNGEFEIIEQKKNTLDDIVDIRNNISRKQSISQEDICLLDSVIPGFINENRMLQMFTKHSSQTLLRETSLAVENIIENEKNEIDETLKKHIENLILRNNELTTLFKTGLSDRLTNQFVTIKGLLDNVIIFSNKRFHEYFNLDLDFKDVFSIPIDELDEEKITQDQRIKNLINEIKLQYKNTNLKSYLFSYRYMSSGSLVFVNERTSDDLVNGMTLNELFKIYQKEIQLSLASKIFLILNNNQEELNILRNKSFIYNRREGDNTATDLNETEQRIVSITKEYKYLFELTIHLVKLNEAVFKLISFFK